MLCFHYYSIIIVLIHPNKHKRDGLISQ